MRDIPPASPVTETTLSATRLAVLAATAAMPAGLIWYLAHELLTVPLVVGDEARNFHDAFSLFIFDLVVGFGFALLLGVAMIALQRRGVRDGFLLGLAGLLMFGLAPALASMPEPPGAPAPDLQIRQLLWAGSAFVTGAGLLCLWLGRTRAETLAGAALIIMPLILTIPAWLARPSSPLFFGIVLSSALFWLVLGPAMGWLLDDRRRPIRS